MGSLNMTLVPSSVTHDTYICTFKQNKILVTMNFPCLMQVDQASRGTFNSNSRVIP